MFRYRCPQCSGVLQALEMRAGKSTVCPKCSRPITIPADRSQWLDGDGRAAAGPPPRPAAPPAEDFSPIPADAPGPAAAPLHAPEPNLPIPAALDSDRDILDTPPPPIVRVDYGDGPTENLVPQVSAPTPPPRAGLPAPDEDTVVMSGPPPAVKPARPPEPPPRPPETPRRPQPRPEPVGVGAGDTPRDPDPGPRPFARRPPRAVVGTPDAGAVHLGHPLHARSDLEIAEELTAALSRRMKPPPEPRRDLNPSTAVWLLLTGAAATCLAFTLFTAADFAPWAAYLGMAQAFVGYLWIVILVGRRNTSHGMACAVPPVTVWFLSRRRFAKYRPLRFVATGAVLVILAGVAGMAAPKTRALVGATMPRTGPAPLPPDVTQKPVLDQLKTYQAQRAIDPLIGLLKRLSKLDPVASEAAPQRAEIAAELKALCGHPLSDVRVPALPAYARWGGEDARGLFLRAITSPSEDERVEAIRVLPRWRDAEVARAVASRLGRPGTETSEAAKALLEMGGPVAEEAVIPLLKRDDTNTRLAAVDILEKVGGESAAAALTDLADTTDNPSLQAQATLKAASIKKRIARKG